MWEEPEPRLSRKALCGFALAIGVIGGFGGHWFANVNTHFMWAAPGAVFMSVLLIALPFLGLGLSGVRSGLVWVLVGTASLLFWGVIFNFLRTFTT